MVYLNVVLTVKAAADIAFVRSTMTELGRLARKDAGCLRFEVYHSQSHTNTFFLVEQWEDHRARLRAYAYEHGEDSPEVTGWDWIAESQGGHHAAN